MGQRDKQAPPSADETCLDFEMVSEPPAFRV